MKDFTSKIPTPITALALGWVILGNVFQGIIPFVSDLCMVISLILIVLTLVSLVLNPKKILDSLKTTVGLSILSCLPMSLMMISVWMKGVFGQSNIYIWSVGLILHTVILIIFTLKHIYNFNISKMTPLWFLVYVGIGVGVITCEDFGMIIFGKVALRFIIVMSIVLSIPILYSIMKGRKSTKNAFKPFFTLIGVPLGIVLPAYIFVSEVVNKNLVVVLFVVIQIIFVIVIISMLYQILNGFFPSWSCYSLSGAFILYASTVANDYLVSKKMAYDFIVYMLDVEYVLVFFISAIILLAYFLNVLDDPATEGTHINLNKKGIERSMEEIELIEEKRESITQRRIRERKEKEKRDKLKSVRDKKIVDKDEITEIEKKDKSIKEIERLMRQSSSEQNMSGTSSEVKNKNLQNNGGDLKGKKKTSESVDDFIDLID